MVESNQVIITIEQIFLIVDQQLQKLSCNVERLDLTLPLLML
jgi:hypothetical protein